MLQRLYYWRYAPTKPDSSATDRAGPPVGDRLAREIDRNGKPCPYLTTEVSVPTYTTLRMAGYQDIFRHSFTYLDHIFNKTTVL